MEHLFTYCPVTIHVHASRPAECVPPTELGMFMALTRAEKQQHLVELTHIVTGIRLFNKESGKGGVGIDECEWGERGGGGGVGCYVCL